MEYTDGKRHGNTALWVTSLVAVAIIVFAICGGAAYTAVGQARLSAARASIGHIEAVLLMSEMRAEKDGLGEPPPAYQNLIKSYDDSSSVIPTSYEKYILTTMNESFGPGRDFDFAVTRYQDSGGSHVQVYYFPNAGRTDMRRDRYYLLTGGVVTEHNA